ncbi:3-hydroxyacyl-[acyl-carrier-protein] dehydratase [Candidatus Ichthyocystis hellenicum]|uniref:3-hydroxyacyl-[acyl-carrier-protein] dehydratase FabZ n=2 Tax=Burkholderiales genera incertae sedis TaxID=224471 RepID=A0A0S4M2J4_9BURK|nr:3-hydroxyacyl-[acyl-carrier-protein] dehydratase [Candidatus Ichthyocystis hellenicum]
MLTISGIVSKLPHRYPFLLVDRVISCDPGQSIVSIKNVTINEPFFVGHFPDNPVMPGVMIIEAMAQTAGLLLSMSLECESEKNSVYYLAGIDGARFRSPVTPGDTMEIKVTMLMNRTSISKYAARVYCSGNLMAEADLLCAKV